MMTPNEILEAGWPVIQRYFEGSSRRFHCNAFVRDLMWDAAVDVLFSMSRHYDGRVPLVAFIQWALRRAWSQLVYERRPLERMTFGWLDGNFGDRLEPLERTDPQAENHWQDQVDGADLMGLVNRLEPENRVALLGVLDGRMLKDVSAELGLNRQTVRARSDAAIRDLKKMVGEEAA